MRPSTAIRLLAAALLALSLLAGCGGGDKATGKDDYAKTFRPINDQFLALGREVAGTIRTAKGQTDVLLADKFAEQAKQVGELKGRLDDVDPPDDYKADHDKLVQAMGVIQADLQAVANAARSHDANGAKASVQKLLRDSEQVRTPRRALAQKTGAKLDQ